MKVYLYFCITCLKGPFLDQRQFLITESSLKMMKNAFYSILKALFVFEMFIFLS